jgi:hypothetical protein
VKLDIEQPPSARNLVGQGTIRFDATLSTIDATTLLRLPQTASKNLPSRGQVAVHGTINGVEFQTVLEPDGDAAHWMRVDDKLQCAARSKCRGRFAVTLTRGVSVVQFVGKGDR